MYNFNQPLQVGVLPISLTTLTLCTFDQPLHSGILPNFITILTLNAFDQPLQVEVLPTFLTILHMDSFNQSLQVDVLPTTITKLYIRNFDQPLQVGMLPSTITTLYINNIDNHPLDVIPEGVVTDPTSNTLSEKEQRIRHVRNIRIYMRRYGVSRSQIHKLGLECKFTAFIDYDEDFFLKLRRTDNRMYFISSEY